MPRRPTASSGCRAVSGAHATLFVHGDSPIHRLAPECKSLATVLFVFAVVATPREAFWAFGVYVAMLVGARRSSPSSRCAFVAGGW